MQNITYTMGFFAEVLIETYWNVNENTVGAHATGCNSY